MAVVRSKNASPTWSDVKTVLLDFDRVGKLGPESVRAELWADDDGQFKLPLE